jgi:hypothetical protein
MEFVHRLIPITINIRAITKIIKEMEEEFKFTLIKINMMESG